MPNEAVVRCFCCFGSLLPKPYTEDRRFGSAKRMRRLRYRWLDGTITISTGTRTSAPQA